MASTNVKLPTHTRATALRRPLALLLCAACTPSPGPAPPVAEIPAMQRTAQSASAALEPPPPKLPGIAEYRVGSLVLDKPLPARLLTEELASRYETTLYSDAQPLEGFVFEHPPVFATVRDGPYHPFGMSTPGEPVPDTMAEEAAALAKAGKLTVSMLVITSVSLRTDQGIGVGSSYREAADAYPRLDTFVFPGLWEEPSCIAKPHPKSTIHFFFAKCAMNAAAGTEKIAPEEKVIRVVLLDTEDDEHATP